MISQLTKQMTLSDTMTIIDPSALADMKHISVSFELKKRLISCNLTAKSCHDNAIDYYSGKKVFSTWVSENNSIEFLLHSENNPISLTFSEDLGVSDIVNKIIETVAEIVGNESY